MPDHPFDSQTPQALCFLQSRERFYFGLLCLLEFSVMDVGLIYFLLDPSPQNPQVRPPSFWDLLFLAIFMGGVMSSMTLGAIWLVAEYLVHRFIITEKFLTLRTCFQSVTIDLRAINKIEWKPTKIMVVANDNCASIDLNGYSEESRADLFDYFHNNFPLEIQHNWLQFVDAVQRDHQPQIPKLCRWLAIPIFVVFLACGGVTLMAWFNLGGLGILLGSLAFFTCGLWYVWAFATFRDENALIRQKNALSTMVEAMHR